MVAAAIIGSAVVGGVAANSAASKSAKAVNKATDAQSQMAADANALGREELEWSKFQYNDLADERQGVYQDSRAVTAAQLATMQQQNELAKDYSDYNKQTFRPLEQRMVAEAQAYDTPERRAAAAAEAVSGVNQQVAAQREASARELNRSGVRPEEGRSMDLRAAGDIGAATASAKAAYDARKGVETIGYARMSDAANLGRGLPSAQATAASTGIQAGNSAIGASGAGLTAAMSGVPIMQSGYEGAMRGTNIAGNLYGNVAANQNALARTQISGALSGAQMGLDAYKTYMTYSSPKVKKNRKPESPKASMEALRETPIESWQYDETKGGPDDDDQTRVGPMADKVNEEMGEEVAPDGEMLNIASMLGVVANGVKDIDERVQRLERKKKGA